MLQRRVSCDIIVFASGFLICRWIDVSSNTNRFFHKHILCFVFTVVPCNALVSSLTSRGSVLKLRSRELHLISRAQKVKFHYSRERERERLYFTGCRFNSQGTN